jgi:serine/threonine protein kinase
MAGTFGKVKMGTHLETGQTVALKFVDSTSISSTREINIMKCLNHEHIVKLYDVLDVPGKYIVAFSKSQQKREPRAWSWNMWKEESCTIQL